MICPNCEGPVGVLDTRHDKDENETLRQKRCKVCGYIFYTVEMIVEETPEFMDTWCKYYRRH